MFDQTLSLREVGRRLGIPPSTIVYYKDKYSRFIPSSGGGSRRQRYSVEVLEIFRRIREMYGMNWSTEQIENELSIKFGMLVDSIKNEQQLINDAGIKSDGDVQTVVQGLASVIEKVSDLLSNQMLFQSEIRDLRDEVSILKSEKRKLEAQTNERVMDLAMEIGQLKRDRVELFRLLRKGGVSSGPDESSFPSAAYLERPLVIQNSEGEYLGVSGKGRKHFSLEDFVKLLENSVNSHRSVDLKWENKDSNWVLVIAANEDVSGDEKAIVLVTEENVTPNNNTVVRIVSMDINNKNVPDALLFSLFKQIRDSFVR
ncbi:MerR HTH family regulatory protein [Maridesulfovibrio ferrireducens]|uniref:MerR HTH family regulatory protein n=1 Tax=Maridesulfovibrio ferrireducens TaxID=246191 RepID=A0A1G9HTS0_9BACT|nr:MerR family transcriptional regulator [Maridesulfovibrio ferrireducens]SDL16216.1 MerR HTH family regulatory protein [Maridesulfovibrio ferrireducens]